MQNYLSSSNLSSRKMLYDNGAVCIKRNSIIKFTNKNLYVYRYTPKHKNV